ncbi:hypothetical protein ACH4PU_31240 [Streptomyces sp. NPDC021100]|uniref:hypothetical protein n=1 Tax=Streptomyces sp. NPDC021100 TaxID=3365114 RepID=UPI0037930A5D
MWWNRLRLEDGTESALPFARSADFTPTPHPIGAAAQQPVAMGKRRWRARRSRPGVRELERRLRQELRELEIQPPLDVEALCRALGRRWDRDIELQPAPLPKPGPLGLLVETPEADIILYQQETTRLHQDHIILHEVGHMLADHDSDETELPSPVPGVEPGDVRKVFKRCSYDNQQECDAELVATIILEWALVLDRVTPPPSADPSVRHVQAALGDHRGWL